MSTATDRLPSTTTTSGPAAMILAVTLGACQSQITPPPEQMSRTTVETAPADLQLLCANAAAQSSGVDSSRVLPIASRRLDDNTYRVELDVTGARVNCSVDHQGTAVSLDPA